MRSLSSESQRGPLPCRYTTTINYHCHGSADDDYDGADFMTRRPHTLTGAGSRYRPNGDTACHDPLAWMLARAATRTRCANIVRL